MNNSLDRPIDAAVCGWNTKHLWSSSTSRCIQAPFFCAAGWADAPPGLSSRVYTHWLNHFFQKVRSHEWGRRGCWPDMEGPFAHTSCTDKKPALPHNTDMAARVCVQSPVGLYSHFFPFLKCSSCAIIQINRKEGDDICKLWEVFFFFLSFKEARAEELIGK